MSDQCDQPSGNGFWRVSTERLGRNDRFDYWRSVFPRIDLELAATSRAKDFAGRALFCRDGRGVVFGHSSISGVVAAHTRADSDFILVGATLEGGTRVRRGHSPALEVTQESGIGIYDSYEPLHTLSQNHAHVYISLPRPVVIDELDGEMGFLQEGALYLPGTGLARSLHAHLQMMARDADHLDDGGTQMSMRIAADLVLGILASQQATRKPSNLRDHTEELHKRALEFIHLHYADPSLVAASVAHDLGCSRAHLYRVFAQRGQSVGDVIRSIRVGRASSLLKARPGIPLARIAILCGYESLSGLTRAFVRETGTTPARLRADCTG